MNRASHFLQCIEVEDTRMDDQTLLKRRTNRSMQAVFEVELVAPPHHVREQIAIERRVIGEQRIKIEGALYRGQLSEAYLPGGHPCPIGD